MKKLKEKVPRERRIFWKKSHEWGMGSGCKLAAENRYEAFVPPRPSSALFYSRRGFENFGFVRNKNFQFWWRTHLVNIQIRGPLSQVNLIFDKLKFIYSLLSCMEAR